MPERTCSVGGCCAPHRARGLCSTHYNQTHQPGRHRARATACTVCGTHVERPHKADRRPVCSVTCRTVLEHGTTAGAGGYSWAQDAAQRARRAGATLVELFDRGDVFERDSWMCGICHCAVDADAPPFHPDSATVDHVVPLSQGGQHTMANVQCAHLRCNSAKQDAYAA